MSCITRGLVVFHEGSAVLSLFLVLFSNHLVKLFVLSIIAGSWKVSRKLPWWLIAGFFGGSIQAAQALQASHGGSSQAPLGAPHMLPRGLQESCLEGCMRVPPLGSSQDVYPFFTIRQEEQARTAIPRWIMRHIPSLTSQK